MYSLHLNPFVPIYTHVDYYFVSSCLTAYPVPPPSPNIRVFYNLSIKRQNVLDMIS